MGGLSSALVDLFTDNSIITSIFSFMANMLIFVILQFATFITTGMLGLGFLITNIIDLFLIQIPDIGNLINLIIPNSKINSGAFLQNTFYYTTIFVIVFSIILWLILGGFNYLKVAISNINNNGNSEDDKKISIMKLVFKMIISLSLIALIPILLKVLFYILYLISILLFKMGIAPLGLSDGNDLNILYKYPVTSVYMIISDVDGDKRKEILYGLEENRNNGKILSTVSTGVNKYISATIGKVGGVLKEAQGGTDGNWITGDQATLGGLITGVAKAMLYIMFVFMLISIIIKLFIILITRFIAIIIHSVFLPLNVIMLGTPYIEKIGLRSIVSYFGSLLISPILYAIIGFGLTVLLTFKSNIIINMVGVTNTDFYLYGTILLLLGYGLFTFLYQVLNNFGTELENIILGYSGRSGYDASQDMAQGLGAAKQYLMINAAQSSLQGLAQTGIKNITNGTFSVIKDTGTTLGTGTIGGLGKKISEAGFDTKGGIIGKMSDSLLNIAGETKTGKMINGIKNFVKTGDLGGNNQDLGQNSGDNGKN